MTRETTEERTRKRWKQALELFDQAFLLAPTEREQFLNSACRQDPDLRPIMEDLFSASRAAESGGFMESPAWSYHPIESNPQIMIGHRIGSYRLTQYLAKGGMGVVYLAERADKVFRRQVAIKFINADTGLKHYSRFRREVQILADLKHPNLVLLYDAGRLGDGRPYLVMEYVEGENLREWAERHGPVPLATVVEIIKQACAGLHAAHQAGVIHRDIKPANIAVTGGNGSKLAVKVLDFGVAARKEHSDSGVSTTKGAVGTLLYMSPEQLQPVKGTDLTPASDVYALGLTAYELLTGTPANDGQSQGEIILKHLQETPDPPSHRRPDLNIPRSFDRVILKALAKAPHERFQSALDFADALEQIFKQPTVWDKSTEDVRNPTPPPKPPPIQSPLKSAPPIQPAPNPKPPNQSPRPARKDKGAFGKPFYYFLAAAGLLAIIAGSIFVIPRLLNPGPDRKPQVQPIAPTQTAPQTTTANRQKPLKLLMSVRNEYGAPLANCSIAIFKYGITALPEKIDESNAIILRTDAQGSAETKSAEVTEDSYLLKITRVGFKTLTKTVKFAEDKTRPGNASLTITLGAE